MRFPLSPKSANKEKRILVLEERCIPIERGSDLASESEVPVRVWGSPLHPNPLELNPPRRSKVSYFYLHVLRFDYVRVRVRGLR